MKRNELATLETDDGISIYYEHHLPVHASGPTVIFSCAYSTTHENWRGQVDPILEASHPVVLWDLRGHGQSPAPDEDAFFTIDLVVSDLLALANATTPDAPFVAAGLSFGGLASLHFMRSHPERVAALALVGSGPGFKNAEAAAGWAAQVERTASYLETRGFAEFVAGKAGVTCIGKKPDLPAAINAANAIRAQSVPGVARFGRRVSGLAPSVIDDLAAMDVPALVLVGESDKAFLRAGEVMAAKLPNARHVVIPGAGHIVNIEEEAAFNEALITFLTEIGTSAPRRERA
jgi:pimeloyl-ACP methyl ester carboxylesterase